MRIRFRGPKGGGSLELAEDATVADLLTALEANTGSHAIVVKFGWPLQTLAADQSDLKVRTLGLQRENLTVVPVESSDGPLLEPITSEPKAVSFTAAGPATAPDSSLAADLAYGSGEDVTVEMPESRTNLVLRVMPDDGDCMFTAVAGALGGLAPAGGVPAANYTPGVLRHIVVSTILGNPIAFNADFLGANPNRYCERIRDGMWGGGIELSILSEAFRIEIHSIDVKTGKSYQFGEQRGYEEFCVLIYSGVHYDRIVEAPTEEGMHIVEFDVARWDIKGNDRITRHAQDVCKVLRDRHYYTSLSDFVVICNQCHEILQGEAGVMQHARQTGHSDVTEIRDTN
ncbi:hypothetical protein F4861DRAFT_66237 [Xylaria intraflava]|nr:hypothetical protein F4861DRAFT_66237 [Xylaria intraflava]